MLGSKDLSTLLYTCCFCQDFYYLGLVPFLILVELVPLRGNMHVSDKDTRNYSIGPPHPTNEWL